MPDEPSHLPPAASAARRPTKQPGVFLIPEDQLPPGFAERVESPPAPPPAARAAATVVLLRADASGQPQALLLRRPRRSRFAADAWVFPGGVVDDADRDPALARHSVGPSPAQWARRLELADAQEAFAYPIGALREAWEETGILLAEGGCAAARAAARRALVAGETTLAEVVQREGLRLHTDALRYVAHWITPEPEPRRYDTRFFVARVPEHAECELLGDELAEFAWLAPAEAVERFRAGTLKLLPPTVDTLGRLAAFADMDALWAGLAEAPVPAILPRMRRTAGGVEIVIGQ